MQTQSIRKAFKARRASLSEQAQSEAASKALRAFTTRFKLGNAKRFGLYWAVKGELPTRPLMAHLLEHDNMIYLPRPDENNPGQLVFGEYRHDTPLTKDRFGISTPEFTRDTAIDIRTLDVILMPLVAADTNGNRLGMGAGFYDKTLAKLDRQEGPLLIGWSYEWQVLDSPLLPAPWDIPLDALVTDEQVRAFSHRARLATRD